ncbi:MAG: hypothetical protein HY062_11500 [Bacteroidetes bacterium]|nr:hypothetical protein [Bacteroidota bacterium]
MKTILLTCMFTTFVYLADAQQVSNSANEKTQSDSKYFYLEKPQGANKAIKTTITQSDYNTPVNVVKSDYNNWENEILSVLTIDYIPKDFPLYKPTMTDDQYKAIIEDWARQNISYFKQPK